MNVCLSVSGHAAEFCSRIVVKTVALGIFHRINGYRINGLQGMVNDQVLE